MQYTAELGEVTGIIIHSEPEPMLLLLLLLFAMMKVGKCELS